jgi:hypothetical protein
MFKAVNEKVSTRIRLIMTTARHFRQRGCEGMVLAETSSGVGVPKGSL